jgi:hypothetical protein
VANIALSYFTTNTWSFTNDKLLWLRTQVLPCDKNDFNLNDLENFDHPKFFKNAIMGGRKYLLKEDTDTLPHARRHYRRYETQEFHSSEDSCCGLLGYDTVQWCGKIPMFWRPCL